MTWSRWVLPAALSAAAACDGGETSSAGGGGHGGGGAAPAQAGAPSEGGWEGVGGFPMLTPCETYCQLIASRCTDTNRQYDDEAGCLAVCNTWVEGTLADMSISTFGCRRHHLDEARDDPDTHCPHAGPTGYGACGGGCGTYCDLAPQLCPTLYADAADCSTTCAAFDASGRYWAGTPDADTLDCRFHHLVLAADDPLTCPDAGPSSEVCVAP